MSAEVDDEEENEEEEEGIDDEDEDCEICCLLFVNVPTIILATPLNAASTDCCARLTGELFAGLPFDVVALELDDVDNAGEDDSTTLLFEAVPGEADD